MNRRWRHRAVALAAFISLQFPARAGALQLHAGSEGIITHQMGHLFFLFSMVALIFILTGKGLTRQRGWRLIQYAAVFFILWNLDAVITHFLDNQIHAVSMKTQSLTRVEIIAQGGSALMAGLYYFLKLDHLLCVPAMLCLYKGLSRLVEDHRSVSDGGHRP